MRYSIFVVLTLMLAGCHKLFGLTYVEGEGDGRDAAVATSCSPIPYDRNRYWSPQGRLWGLSWSGQTFGAREACAARGMDLAVLNADDSDELANQSGAAAVPFWLGVSYGETWTAIDGCMPYLGWAPGEPTVEAPGQCVVQTGTGIGVRSCGHQPTEAGEHIQALCETPRPDARCRALAAQSSYAVASTQLLTRDAARIECERLGMHLVEINASTELAEIRQGVAAGIDAFWIDASYTTQWISTSNCPQVFEWSALEPNLQQASPGCVIVEPEGMRIVQCEDLAAAVCEGGT